MALPRDYDGQACSLARALEIIGERWTLLVIRDAFYGVRRFSDFLVHLQIPRAVLADRLAGLVGAGVLERVPGPSGHDEYAMTAKGRDLWPALHSLTAWGDQHYAAAGPRRLFVHAACGTEVDAANWCPSCQVTAGVVDLSVIPGPGLAPLGETSDTVTVALAQPHHLLEPLAAGAANRRQTVSSPT